MNNEKKEKKPYFRSVTHPKGFTIPVKRYTHNCRNRFGNFITRRRRELNISNFEFGKRAKASNMLAFAWEAGERLPSLITVRRIAKALEVKPDVVRKEIAMGKIYRVLFDLGFNTDEKPDNYVVSIKKNRKR